MRVIILLVAASFLHGCYYAHTARGQMELLAKREPIDKLIEASETPDLLREQLVLARDIRRFASDELGLPDNRSYTYYADLGRPFALWSVVATEEFSVHPITWCFPFAGCVAYRGYFDEVAANRFAERLRRRGHDVRVGGVAAYSTLGWFADPLLNTMLRRDEIELAAVIFHELAHQEVYVRGDTAFNEAFATVVEEEGLRRWLERRGRAALMDEYRARRARRDDFGALVGEARAELHALYTSGRDAESMREGKRVVFERLRERHRHLRDERWGGHPAYDQWFRRELNNADLAGVATYNERVPALRTLLEELGHDLTAFYREAPKLAQPN